MVALNLMEFSKCNYPGTEELLQFQTIIFWISGVVTLTTASFGLFGNLVSMLVLCKKNVSSVFNHLLVCLCLADMVFLLSNLLMSPIAFGHYTTISIQVFHVSECISHVSLATSIFITVSISIERYQVGYSCYNRLGLIIILC